MNNKKQRNRLFTMLMLVMAILMPYEGAWAQTPTPPSKGDGKKDSPYIITKAEELAWFRNQVNSGQYSICAKIADNVEVIDMSTVCHAADKSQNLEEKSWVPIGNRNIIKYRGTFDGNGKTITNLYINASQTSQNNMGLFGYTYQSTIKNLTFENANVTNTQSNTGILVGKAGYGSTLQNIKISKTCQIKGGNYTGGIAGILDGNAYNCVNYATVQGIQYVGGLCGNYSRTGNSMIACANYGNVTSSSLGVGGLVGDFSSGTIQDCANYGNVKGANSVAGMAGFVDKGKIQNVFSYGSISATNGTEVGMVLGYSKYGATEGMVAYYSGAKLTANSQEITVKAFGSGNLSEDNATGFTETQLKSGVVAYQLQQNASNGAKWGQNLADSRDQYPVPGSDNKVIKAAQGDKDANGNDTYWATFSNLKNDVTLSVPSDRTLKVYNATVSGGKMTLTERNSQVAKDEGVLLKTDGEYVNAKANETNELTKASSDENHLVATPAEAQTVTAETGCKLYRLTYKNATNKERLGFYLSVDKANNSSDGTSLKATPGKAYLKVSENEAKDPSSAALARSFVFGGGNETTGIEGITIMGTDVQRHNTLEGIFDLQGRKISNPTKGIYIKNNKKVVIK